MNNIPTYNVDFYSDEVIKDPFPHYAKMRELGPVVWLPHQKVYALSRYKEVSEVLRQPLLFTSSQGVSLNPKVNNILKGSTLNSDPPIHDRTRAITAAPLLPGALKAVDQSIKDAAILERLSNAREMGIKGLENPKLTKLFITHFHPDHTLGLAGFMIAPWNMQRWETLKIYGPKGIEEKVNGLLEVFDDGINEHLHSNPKDMTPISVEPIVYSKGIFYKDDLVTVEAIPVVHGSFEAYAFKFTTPDKTIVISGDTCPVAELYDKAKGCDILVHEVYTETLLKGQNKEVQAYFKRVHTGGYELGKIAQKVQPNLLVLTHQMAYGSNSVEGETAILQEIKESYSGPIAYGNDLDVFE